MRSSLRLLLDLVAGLLGDRTVWRLAWRNVGRNGRRTGIVVAAVAVGLAASIVTMGLNFAFMVQMVETVISTELGHVQVHASGFEAEPGLEKRIGDAARVGEVIGRVDGVEAWAPRVRGEGLVFSSRASAGVSLVGVDPAREAGVSVVESSITEGSYLGGGARRVLIGERLAERLEIGVGDKVVVSAQDLGGDVVGEAFRVGGLFRTASMGLDESTVFVRLEDARPMLGLGDEVSEFVLLAPDREDVASLGLSLRSRLGPDYEVRTWEELQPMLVYMLDVFESMAWVIYAAVFVAMTFGIANVLLMSVHERFREIGVMMSIGMAPGRLVALIVAEGILVAGIGVAVGLALTAASLVAFGEGLDLSRWQEGLNAFGVGTRVAPRVRPGDLVTPLVVALVTAVVASLWPAVRAARVRPAEAVRHL